MSREMTATGGLRAALVPTSFGEVMKFAEMMSNSQFVPQGFRGKPGDIVAAITYGADLGLSPMQALQNVAIVNGKPAVYGDGLLAVCQSHPAWGGKKEWLDGEGDRLTAHCVVSRKGEPDAHVTFSVADAKKANLWGKAGPWQQYAARMLQMRARGFALRDQFADALKGIISVEEAADYPPQGPNGARDVTPLPPRTAAPLADPAEVVAVFDEFGQEELLPPAAIAEWAKERAAEASDEGLEELRSQNADTPAVVDAVDAEKAKRARKAKPRKLPLFDAGNKVAAEYDTATDWLAGLEMVAKGDALPALVSANGGLLRKLADGASTPTDLKLRAEDLLLQAETVEAA